MRFRWTLAIGSIITIGSIFGGFLVIGCNNSADSLPEWKPSDHDHVEEATRQQNGMQAAASPDGGNRQDVLIEVTWQKQCAQCHGLVGHADGPTAPMTHPRDLTDEKWQSGITDAELATSIKNGKGRMPKFDLPDDVIAGLVARIRLSAGK